MKTKRELLMTPVALTVGTGLWLGSKALETTANNMEASKRLAGRVGNCAVKAVHSQRLGEHLRNRHFEHAQEEKDKIVEEIISRKDDYQLVDFDAQRWLAISLRHAEQVSESAVPATDEYIAQIEQIMKDGNLPEPTIDIAVQKLRRHSMAVQPPDGDSFEPQLILIPGQDRP